MSLQIAAQHLSSQGRGKDSTLVHMSPREVSSLNAIAKAHGGQLTTNPHTGLPEAGFLESILPMAAGAALVASGVGAPYAALMVGGGTALMTGSLEKGLMAGLGAYGGAGLGSSLMASGATPAAAGATELGISEAMQAQHAAQVTAAQTAQQAQQAAAIQNAAIQQGAAVSTPVIPATSISGLNPGAISPTPGVMNSADLLAKQNAMSGSMPINASVTATPPNASHYSVATGTSPSFQANVPPAPSFMDNIKSMGSNISPSNLMKFAKEDPLSAASGAASLYPTKKKEEEAQANNADMGQRYGFSPGYVNPMPSANPMGQEQTFMNSSYRPIDNAEAKKIYGYAEGGTPEADPAAPPVPTSYTAAQPSTPIGMPAPAFSIPDVNSMEDLIRAKESQRFIDAYLNRPELTDAQAEYSDYLQKTLNAPSTLNSSVRTAVPSATANADNEFIFDANTQRFTSNPKYVAAQAAIKKKSALGNLKKSTPFVYTGNQGGYGASAQPKMDTNARSDPFGRAAGGSISDAGYNLGGYSDGGRLLRGPGDGVSDSIPAVIGKKQPARLADGEFVVPARIVSELGNGSTEAGARKLYAMMDRIQKARKKTVGKGKVAKNSRSDKYLPA
jgi:hypothetical protein